MSTQYRNSNRLCHHIKAHSSRFIRRTFSSTLRLKCRKGGSQRLVENSEHRYLVGYIVSTIEPQLGFLRAGPSTPHTKPHTCPAMRRKTTPVQILCLHGMGDNSEIFRAQTGQSISVQPSRPLQSTHLAFLSLSVLCTEARPSPHCFPIA